MDYRKKLLIFDWDGTLLDSHQAVIKSHIMALEEKNIQSFSKQQIERSMGKPGKALCHEICQNTKIDPLDYYATFSKYYQKNANALKLFPNALETLKSLKKQQFILTIATNKPKILAQKELRETEVYQFFSDFQYADHAKAKPDPKMLLHHCQKQNIHPENALMIGDQMDDAKASENANMACIIVHQGTIPTWQNQTHSTETTHKNLHEKILKMSKSKIYA